MMRMLRSISVTLLALAAGSGAAAAADLSVATHTAALCAITPATGDLPDPLLHVMGVQDPAERVLYGPRDRLVIDGGLARGVQLEQRFIVRRPPPKGVGVFGRRGLHTAGWVTITAVNDAMAIATVEHACDGIMPGDVLYPWTDPALPDGIEQADASGELDFTAPARVVFGNNERMLVATGDFVLMDAGQASGVTAGSRFGIYRDLQVSGLPLHAVGEAVAVVVHPDSTLVRITSARSAVMRGDVMVPRK
jgi:hypothetical protein